MQPYSVKLLSVVFALIAACIPYSFPQAAKNTLVESSKDSHRSEADHKHYASMDIENQPEVNGQLAPKLLDLGPHEFTVSTQNQSAQLFINQGINLAYAFNHAESRRAFREAARLDPALAMAYWGQALVLGPNINAMMEPNEEPQALALTQKAKSLILNSSVNQNLTPSKM